MEGGARGLKVMFANTQSVVNKVDELRAVVSVLKPEVIALTESWTNESIGDDHLVINGYEMVARKDRRDTDRGRGGGLLVYVCKSLDAWNIEKDTEFNQCVSIGIKCRCEDINIHIVYRSPNSNKYNDDALGNKNYWKMLLLIVIEYVPFDSFT